MVVETQIAFGKTNKKQKVRKEGLLYKLQEHSSLSKLIILEKFEVTGFRNSKYE